MFQQVSIRNYQSLKRVDLDLGPLTVVVGDSSSGKSALMRAFRMLICNERGSSFVTHGEKAASVAVKGNQWQVALEKGSSNTGEYRVHSEGATPPEAVYTKLAGTVPEEVSRILGMEASSPGLGADQFEAPYLLKESGQTVANVLGSLTGVSAVFEAVREANRRRLEAAHTLKIKSGELSQVKDSLRQFVSLPEDLRLLQEAEAAYLEISKLTERQRQLQLLVVSLEQAHLTLSDAPSGEVPNIAPAEEALEFWRKLSGLLVALQTDVKAYKRSQELADGYRREQEVLMAKFDETLKLAGVCPVCQQEIAGAASRA